MSYCGEVAKNHIFDNGICLNCSCSDKFHKNETARNAAKTLFKIEKEELKLRQIVFDDEQKLLQI